MSEIPIANICHMLAYAYGGGFREILTLGIGQADASECKEAHTLYAELLLRGVKKLVRKGLFKQDLMFHEVLPSPRGRIDAVRTVTSGEHFRARVVCHFGEMSEDCLPNRVIKTTLHHLLKLEGVKKKADVKRMLALMDDISLVDLSSVSWESLSGIRLPASYRCMLGLCQLIVKGLLQEGRDGTYRVIQFDDERKASLFEAFVRGFYKEKFASVSLGKKEIKWHLDDKNKTTQNGLESMFESDKAIPRMYADIMLKDGEHALIIDTKFYKKARQSNYTANSANFYQIYSYVKNADKEHTGNVRGLLLYAKTEGEEELKVDCSIDGNAFFIRMVDLSVPEFKKVEDQLSEFVSLMDCDVRTARHIAV